MKNYYDLLEVTPKASKEIIEKAYRVLIKKYHPDLYNGEERIYAENKSKDLNEAYRVLSNDFLRKQYDLELEKEKQFNNYEIENNMKQNTNNSNSRNKKREVLNKEKETNEKKHQVGSFMAMVDLLKEIFKKTNKKNKPRKLQKEDKIAAVLTAIIVIVIGIALWFIPFTHNFIRDLIPF